MSKPDPDSSKRQQRAAARWALTIFLVTIVVSATISFASGEVMARSSMAVAFLILLIIVAVGILFDIVGVAVTSADEKPFHSMASRRVPGAKEAIRLLRNAGRVSSICNDVIGDICGVVSGAASATIAARALTYIDFSWPQAVSLGSGRGPDRRRQSRGQNRGYPLLYGNRISGRQDHCLFGSLQSRVLQKRKK